MAARPKGRNWRKSMFDALVERDGDACSKCRAQEKRIWRQNGLCTSSWLGDWSHTIVYPTSNLEIDHRTPLSVGGTNDIDNLWLLCVDCHKRKTSSERSARANRLFAEAVE